MTTTNSPAADLVCAWLQRCGPATQISQADHDALVDVVERLYVRNRSLEEENDSLAKELAMCDDDIARRDAEEAAHAA